MLVTEVYVPLSFPVALGNHPPIEILSSRPEAVLRGGLERLLIVA
jgi:hypothetical protein